MASCPTTLSNIIRIQEKSTFPNLREIQMLNCKKNMQETYSASNSRAEQTCAQELLLKEKKDAKSKGAGEAPEHQKILKYFIVFLSTAGDWRNCAHRGCCWWLPLLQEVSWCFSSCVRSLKSLGKDFDFTEADVQEGRRPCAWAHWGWFTQWLEGGWGQGQLEVGQLRGWQFQGWQLQDWQLRGQIEILIWHSSVTPFHCERLRKCVHRLWSEINTCFTLHFWLFDTFDMGGEWTRRPGIKGCHCIGCLSPKLNPINYPDQQIKWHIAIVFGLMHTSDTASQFLCSWTGDT